MAARISSYNTLVSAVAEMSEDVGSELLDYLPVAIDNAENRLARELDFLGMVYTSTLTIAASTQYLAKPAGHKLTHYLTYVDPTTARTTVLDRKTASYLDEYWPHPTSVATPKYYTDIDLNTFRICPCTSALSSIYIAGVRRPDPLSVSNQTNIFTSVAADALYYATMIEISLWQRNDPMKQSFQDLYVAARDAINIEGSRQRRDDGAPVTSPQSGQNTLGILGNK